MPEGCSAGDVEVAWGLGIERSERSCVFENSDAMRDGYIECEGKSRCAMSRERNALCVPGDYVSKGSFGFKVLTTNDASTCP